MDSRVLSFLLIFSLFSSQAFGQHFALPQYEEDVLKSALGMNSDINNNSATERVKLWLEPKLDNTQGSVFNPIYQDIFDVYKQSLGSVAQNAKARKEGSGFLNDVIKPLERNDLDKLTTYADLIKQVGSDVGSFYMEKCGSEFDKNKPQCQQAEKVIESAHKNKEELVDAVNNNSYGSLSYINQSGFFSDVDYAYESMNQIKDGRLLRPNFQELIEKAQNQTVADVWNKCTIDFKAAGKASDTSNVYKSVDLIAGEFSAGASCNAGPNVISEEQQINMSKMAKAMEDEYHSPMLDRIEAGKSEVQKYQEQYAKNETKKNLALALSKQIKADAGTNMDDIQKEYTALEENKEVAQKLSDEMEEFNKMCKELYHSKKELDEQYKPVSTASLRARSQGGYQGTMTPNYELIAQSNRDYYQKLNEFKSGVGSKTILSRQSEVGNTLSWKMKKAEALGLSLPEGKSYKDLNDTDLKRMNIDSYADPAMVDIGNGLVVGVMTPNRDGQMKPVVNSMQEIWNQNISDRGIFPGSGATALVRARFMNLMQNDFMDKLILSPKFQRAIGMDKISSEESMVDRCISSGSVFGKRKESSFLGHPIYEGTDREDFLTERDILEAYMEVKDGLIRTTNETDDVMVALSQSGYPDMAITDKFLKDTVRDRPLALIKFIQSTQDPNQSALLCGYLQEAMEDEEYHDRVQMMIGVGTIAGIGLAIGGSFFTGGSSLLLISGLSFGSGAASSAYILNENSHLKTMEYKQQLAVINKDMEVYDQLTRGEQIDEDITVNTLWLGLNAAFMGVDVAQGMQGLKALRNPATLKKLGQATSKVGGKVKAGDLVLIDKYIVSSGSESVVLKAVEKCVTKTGTAFKACMDGLMEASEDFLIAVKTFKEQSDQLAKNEEVMKAIGVKSGDKAKYYETITKIAVDPEYSKVLKQVDVSNLSDLEKIEARSLILDIVAVKQFKGKTQTQILEELKGVLNSCRLAST